MTMMKSHVHFCSQCAAVGCFDCSCDGFADETMLCEDCEPRRLADDVFPPLYRAQRVLLQAAFARGYAEASMCWWEWRMHTGRPESWQLWVRGSDEDAWVPMGTIERTVAGEYCACLGVPQ